MATPRRSRSERSPLIRWGLPFASVFIAHLANNAFPESIFPSPFFIAAVMITAHLGGSGPAALAFVLAFALLDYFHVPPFNTFAIRSETLPALLQFIIPCLLGAWFILKRGEIERLLQRETEVGKRLQGELSPADIGGTLLKYLAPELDAPLGAFYTIDADGTARRRAGHAFDETQAPATFAAGQGLIGLFASETSPRVIDVPADYVTVRSSLGMRRPSSVVLVPAHDGERTRAVLELGFFRRVNPEALHLFERIAQPIAVAVRTAMYREQLQDLLEETRRQAEELRSHDEELRATNEELTARGAAMVDAQKKLEAQQIELEQSNELLRNQARLLEQQNDELGQAHEIVRLRSQETERANRAKSEFLANMSHELRTPLNSSLILAKLLMEDRDGNLTPEQIRFAQTIYSAGNDLLVMIDDILDLSKIEAGKIELRVETVPMTRIRDEMRSLFEPVAKERGIFFDVQIQPGAWSALDTDLQRLSQILKNLLSNAFKFTERGQVSLWLGSSGDSARFVVKDTGIGIAPDQLGVIFEAFRQADGTSNRRYGGTGLGLSISRDLARMLGGEIQVTSAIGAGSTFTLELPRTLQAPATRRDVAADHRPPPLAPEHQQQRPLAPPQLADQPRPSRVDAAAARGNGAPTGAGRVILVIEDDPGFAEIVVGLAQELGFRGKIASNADEALALALKDPPDGIVLDMKLPDHSGLSVLDRLKREPRTRHVPVHVISVENYTRTALEMGAIGYMLKPIEREQIKAALQKLESRFTRTVRRLLVVEDDLTQRDAICQLLGGDNVEIIAVGTMREALDILRGASLDCVVIDLALPDGSGYDLLETMANDEGYSFPSVVVYTGRSLSAEEEQRLRQYSHSIIVKGARSPERLLDEVTLFLHQVEATLPPERQRMLRKVRSREAIFEDRQVLIVEDDVRNVFALSNVLEPKGMKLTVARNGREALSALEQNPGLELVLMDIMMPEMDGLEATRAIRRDARWSKLPIIALTAKAMKDDQERCLKAGANECIPKPLDVDMLLSLLRIWMAK
jgi:signal transduction histidine kinase/CheY-like chemotaxis protein